MPAGTIRHVAMLMASPRLLAGMRNDSAGTVTFIFQPAEEGAPAGERGGAALMIEEGRARRSEAQRDLRPARVPYPAGEIRYRPGGHHGERGRLPSWCMAADPWRDPWAGIDPIVVGRKSFSVAEIASRQVDVTAAPAIVTWGASTAAFASNIIRTAW